MATKAVFHCSRVPKPTCSVQISGEPDDVVQAAKDHLTATHPETVTPGLHANVTAAIANPSAMEEPYHWTA
jgi:predicted small metal-binding protein